MVQCYFGKVAIDKIPSENYNDFMIYTTKELLKLLNNFRNINSAVNEGRYYKIGHGLYTDEGPYISELEQIFAQHPNAVLTMQSAFARYSITDYVPDKYYVATSQKAHKIQNKKVSQLYISDKILNIGKVKVETKYGYYIIYDKERMLIELFRLKSKFGYDYYKEAVNCYRRLALNDELDFYKLGKYLDAFPNGNKLEKQIQEIIL